MMRKILLFCFIHLWAVTAAAGAGAQDPSMTKSELAKQYFNKGVALYTDGDYEAALNSFLKSYELRPHDKLRYNIGVCLYFLGEYAKAGNEFVRFLAKEIGDADPNMLKEALKALEDIKQKCGTLKFKAEGSGIDIWIDGENHGEIPLATVTYVDPGTHAIKACLGDEVFWAAKVTVGAAEIKTFNVAISAKPGDKKKAEEKYLKWLEKQNRLKAQSAKTKVHRTLFYVTLALAVAAAAAGAASGGIALDTMHELDDLDRDCESDGCGTPGKYDHYLAKRSDLYGEAEVSGNTSTGLFAVSGALALSSLIILLVTKPFKKESSKSISSQSPQPLLLPGRLGPVLTLYY